METNQGDMADAYSIRIEQILLNGLQPLEILPIFIVLFAVYLLHS